MLPPTPDANKELEVGKGEGEFQKLLKALSDQYQEDLRDAARQTKSMMLLAPPRKSEAPPPSIAPHCVSVETEGDCSDQVRKTASEAQTSVVMKTNSDGTASSTDSFDIKLSGSMRSQESIAVSTYRPALNRIKRFARSDLFDRVSASLLILNAGFIGVQVQYSFLPEEPIGIRIGDYIFCVLFIIELATRIYGLGCRSFWCSKDDMAWNIFDFSIVLLSTADTLVTIAAAGGDSPLGNVSVLRVVRIIRITRVLRIIRVMKFFRDLRILVSAIASTIKTASFALMLIFFTMYLFGVALTQMASYHVKEMEENGVTYEADSDMMFFFGGIMNTVFCLFMTIAGGIDWKDAVIPLMEIGAMALTFFLLYVLLMVLCIMNVLTGIFCQSAIDTAAHDRENIIQLQLQEKARFIETLEDCFDGMDSKKTGIIDYTDFQAHLTDESVQNVLKSLEIDVRDALTLFELLDADSSGEVNVDEFVTGCITLRGGAKAVQMEKIEVMTKIFCTRFDDLESKIADVVGTWESIKHDIRYDGSRRRSSMMNSKPNTRSSMLKRISAMMNEDEPDVQHPVRRRAGPRASVECAYDVIKDDTAGFLKQMRLTPASVS